MAEPTRVERRAERRRLRGLLRAQTSRMSWAWFLPRPERGERSLFAPGTARLTATVSGTGLAVRVAHPVRYRRGRLWWRGQAFSTPRRLPCPGGW